MSTYAITVETLCANIGHWSVAVRRDGAEVLQLRTEWPQIQEPLDDNELAKLALLILRAKYSGVPLEGLGELLLNGVTL